MSNTGRGLLCKLKRRLSASRHARRCPRKTSPYWALRGNASTCYSMSWPGGEEPSTHGAIKTDASPDPTGTRWRVPGRCTGEISRQCLAFARSPTLCRYRKMEEADPQTVRRCGKPPQGTRRRTYSTTGEAKKRACRDDLGSCSRSQHSQCPWTTPASSRSLLAAAEAGLRGTAGVSRFNSPMRSTGIALKSVGGREDKHDRWPEVASDCGAGRTLEAAVPDRHRLWLTLRSPPALTTFTVIAKLPGWCGPAIHAGTTESLNIRVSVTLPQADFILGSRREASAIC